MDGSSDRPRLWGPSHEGRLAVTFSADDITAGLVGYPRRGLRGYEPDSASALMRNAVLFACGKPARSPSGRG